MTMEEGFAEECQVLRGAAGARLLSARAHVDVTDRHRARFIHNMSTCDVNGLSEGQGAFGLTVDRGGKLIVQHLEQALARLSRGCSAGKSSQQHASVDTVQLGELSVPKRMKTEWAMTSSSAAVSSEPA